jgi:TRAP-type C4-dicarboxylate transport system substrate-binding protein
MKLRVTAAPVSLDLFKTLGATPVSMDISEVYTALQTHLLDGADDPILNIYSLHYYEVQKYLSITNHQWPSYWMCINKDAWQSLPSDLQGILRRNSNQAGVREVKAIDDESNAIAAKLVQHGMIRNVADQASFRARLSSYYQRWKREFGSSAWAAAEKYAGKLA